MARNKWNKYKKVSENIVEILNEQKCFLSTNAVRTILDEKYLQKVHHKTVEKYLSDMEKEGVVVGFSENSIKMWKLENGECDN